MVRYILDNGNRKASSGDEDLVFTVMKNMLVQFCQAVAELHLSVRLFLFVKSVGSAHSAMTVKILPPLLLIIR